MDIDFPDIDGIEVAKRLKIIHPNIQIIILTSKVERISIKIGEGRFFWSVTISNATLNTSMLKTSKNDKKNHGFGLKHVKEIVKKYDGKFNNELLQNCFIANITLKK